MTQSTWKIVSFDMKLFCVSKTYPNESVIFYTTWVKKTIEIKKKISKYKKG